MVYVLCVFAHFIRILVSLHIVCRRSWIFNDIREFIYTRIFIGSRRAFYYNFHGIKWEKCLTWNCLCMNPKNQRYFVCANGKLLFACLSALTSQDNEMNLDCDVSLFDLIRCTCTRANRPMHRCFFIFTLSKNVIVIAIRKWSVCLNIT